MILDCIYFSFSLLVSRETRASMQVGQSATKGSTLLSREVSAAITMIALVIIYSTVNAANIIFYALDGVLNLISPTGYVNDVLFKAAQFTQVCEH